VECGLASLRRPWLHARDRAVVGSKSGSCLGHLQSRSVGESDAAVGDGDAFTSGCLDEAGRECIKAWVLFREYTHRRARSLSRRALCRGLTRIKPIMTNTEISLKSVLISDSSDSFDSFDIILYRFLNDLKLSNISDISECLCKD